MHDGNNDPWMWTKWHLLSNDAMSLETWKEDYAILPNLSGESKIASRSIELLESETNIISDMHKCSTFIVLDVWRKWGKSTKLNTPTIISKISNGNNMKSKTFDDMDDLTVRAMRTERDGRLMRAECSAAPFNGLRFQRTELFERLVWQGGAWWCDLCSGHN